jgi:hypothetical protein
MAKKDKYDSVEVQKGPIRMDAQYVQKFYREPDHTMKDIEHNMMRQDMKTLTLHVPKQ